MKRALSLACSLSAAAALAGPALAQEEPAARLTGRAIGGPPPLSTRALPAAPPVHRLSIGPLAAPSDATASTIPDTTAAETLEVLLERARRGDAHANYRLGLRYLAGDGVVRDLVEAFARVRLAAAAGHPRAVSLFYFLGAKLTAEEHAQAYERAQHLRSK